MNRLPGNSRGFSLTELLVAMVIGLFLLGGLVTLMVNSKKNYAQQDYSARLQENARFAMQFLSYDIRMAGYFGCSNNIINNGSIAAFNVPEPDTAPDKVTITYSEPQDLGNEANVSSIASGTWTLDNVPDDWSAGNNVVIADCGSAVATSLTSVDHDNNQITINTSDFSRSFDPDVTDAGPITVRRLVSHTYAVEDSGESGVPVLTRNGRELVEGIENIRFLYQTATGAFVAGDDSDAPDNPVAVQLGALVRSISNEELDPSRNPNREYGSGTDLTVDKGQHTVLDQNVDVGELRGLRRVFTTTLAVRNRSL